MLWASCECDPLTVVIFSPVSTSLKKGGTTLKVELTLVYPEGRRQSKHFSHSSDPKWFKAAKTALSRQIQLPLCFSEANHIVSLVQTVLLKQIYVALYSISYCVLVNRKLIKVTLEIICLPKKYNDTPTQPPPLSLRNLT